MKNVLSTVKLKVSYTDTTIYCIIISFPALYLRLKPLEHPSLANEIGCTMVRWHRNSKTPEWSHEGSRSLEKDGGGPIQEHHVFLSSIGTTYAALGVCVYNITQDTHVTLS